MDFEPQRRVMVSKASNREAFHTNECHRVKRSDSNMKLITFRDATGFFELTQCSFCQDKEILDERVLAEIADAKHSGWDFTEGPRENAR
jgi:hypothetical protein